MQPQNILLTDALPDGDIKLCDFGLARPFNRGDDVVEIVGTLDYVGKSSQDVQDRGLGTFAILVWSVGRVFHGCVLYSLEL